MLNVSPFLILNVQISAGVLTKPYSHPLEIKKSKGRHPPKMAFAHSIAVKEVKIPDPTKSMLSDKEALVRDMSSMLVQVSVRERPLGVG